MGALKISKIKKRGEDYQKIISFPECALCNQPKDLLESHIISKMCCRTNLTYGINPKKGVKLTCMIN